MAARLRNDRIAQDMIETMLIAANKTADVPLPEADVIKIVRQYQDQAKGELRRKNKE